MDSGISLVYDGKGVQAPLVYVPTLQGDGNILVLVWSHVYICMYDIYMLGGQLGFTSYLCQVLCARCHCPLLGTYSASGFAEGRNSSVRISTYRDNNQMLERKTSSLITWLRYLTRLYAYFDLCLILHPIIRVRLRCFASLSSCLSLHMHNHFIHC